MCSLIHLKGETDDRVTAFVRTCFEGDVGLLSLLLEYLKEVGRQESVDTPTMVSFTELPACSAQR